MLIKGCSIKNLGRYDEAAEQLDKSLEYIQNGNSSLLFYILQVYGDYNIPQKLDNKLRYDDERKKQYL